MAKTIIDDLVKALKKDKDYYMSWQSNIAMAYIDNERWYKEKHKKKYLNRKDKHTIANNSAKYFLDLLIKPIKKDSRKEIKDFYYNTIKPYFIMLKQRNDRIY